MYYKVEKGTELFDKLDALFEEAESANKAVREWVKTRFGDKVEYYSPAGNLGGGFMSVLLPDKPAGYKGSYRGSFEPRKDNKEDLKAIQALPVVKMSRYKNLLEYGFYMGPGTRDGYKTSDRPGLIHGDGYYLLSTPEWVSDWTPPADVIEIKGSEYHLLKEQAQELQNA